MTRSDIKDKRRQQLINATIDSIAKRGLTETTITHISKGAGLSRGIVNFYFTSKEMMMREVLGNLIEQYEAVWTTAQKDKTEPREVLEAIVRAHFDSKICSAKRLNVMSAFWGHAATHDAYREKIDASDSALQGRIEALWLEIAPEGYDPKHFSRQLHAMIRGLWLSFLMAPKTNERASLAAECLSFIERHQEPLRVIEGGEVVAQAKPVAQKPKVKVKAEVPADSQMDFGDLFARIS